MRLVSAFALVLCGGSVMQACGPAAPDDSLARTSDDEHFEVAVKGVTGAHIDVRAEVALGRRCSIPTATDKGVPVLLDVLVRDGEGGKKLIELRLVENPANQSARTLCFSRLLAPGQSDVTGPGWNSLFDIRLTPK
jgi:hypothetical protein